MPLMNRNLIELPSCSIEIQKLSAEQYRLLRLVQRAIIENMTRGVCTIDLEDFVALKPHEIFDIACDNIKVILRRDDVCECFDIINEIKLNDNVLEFSPAKTLIDLVTKNGSKSTMRHLHNILFNGIRSKQALLLIDHFALLNPTEEEKKVAISIEDLRDLLKIEAGQYQAPTAFRKFVIDRIIPEINQKTQLTISYEVQFEGVAGSTRKMKAVALEFTYLLRDEK